MKLVVGLGNPGARYAETRHNVGFMVVDSLRQSTEDPSPLTPLFGGQFSFMDFETQRVGLLKPQTFMNRSGLSVAEALSTCELTPEDLIIIHDDLDLPFGAVRVKVGGGSGGHRGLQSCFAELGTREFSRARVGIGRPAAGQDATAYVLEAFDEAQRGGLAEVERLAAAAARETISVGAMAAMNRFNRRTTAPDGGER